MPLIFPKASFKWKNALNQNVDRIIITPGAGDRALWTSTELGSLITQFKGYGQGDLSLTIDDNGSFQVFGDFDEHFVGVSRHFENFCCMLHWKWFFSMRPAARET